MVECATLTNNCVQMTTISEFLGPPVGKFLNRAQSPSHNIMSFTIEAIPSQQWKKFKIRFYKSTFLQKCSHRLMTAWSSGNLKTLGLGLPSWASGVTLPTCSIIIRNTHLLLQLNTSTKPNPMWARPVAASAPLSKPAATPTGLGKVRFHSFTCTGTGSSHNKGLNAVYCTQILKCPIHWTKIEIVSFKPNRNHKMTTCNAGSFCCLQAGWIPLLRLHTASLWPVSPSVTLLIGNFKAITGKIGMKT